MKKLKKIVYETTYELIFVRIKLISAYAEFILIFYSIVETTYA